MVYYASVVVAGFTAVSAVWYLVWGRKNFVGPVMHIKGPNGEFKAVDAQPANNDPTEDNISEKIVV